MPAIIGEAEPKTLALLPYEKYVLCTGCTAPDLRTERGLFIVEDKDLACERLYVLKSSVEGVHTGDVIFSPKSFVIWIGMEGKALCVIHRDYIVARLPAGEHPHQPRDMTHEVVEAVAAIKSQKAAQFAAQAAAINSLNGKGIIH
jgi:hypothetical protein